MERVTVEAVCVLPKTEPGHPPIYFPHNLLWWRSTVNRHRSKVNWHRSKVFYFCGHGEWLLSISGRRGSARNTGIIHPVRKVAVESYSYGGPKYSSNICSNEDEATDGMGHTIHITRFKFFFINNYCWWCIIAWAHRRADSSLFKKSTRCP